MLCVFFYQHCPTNATSIECCLFNKTNTDIPLLNVPVHMLVVTWLLTLFTVLQRRLCQEWSPCQCRCIHILRLYLFRYPFIHGILSPLLRQLQVASLSSIHAKALHTVSAVWRSARGHNGGIHIFMKDFHSCRLLWTFHLPPNHPLATETSVHQVNYVKDNTREHGFVANVNTREGWSRGPIDPRDHPDTKCLHLQQSPRASVLSDI